MDLSIIIISYNTKDLLRKCLLSIERAINDYSYEIIVVDNASSDGTVEMIKNEFPLVHLIINKENIGFAKANNYGIQYAKGRYILLLNSDAILHTNCLNKMIKFMEMQKNAAALSPKVLNLDDTLQSKGNHFPSLTKALLLILKINKILPKKYLYKIFPNLFWDENEIRKVDWISGCCMLIKKDALKEIGLLPESYFMYYEDLEWCLLAKNKGYDIWYYPKATITHISSSSPNNEIIKISVISTLMFFRKHSSKFYGAIYLILELILALESLILNILFPLSKKRIKNYYIKFRFELRRSIILIKLLFKKN